MKISAPPSKSRPRPRTRRRVDVARLPGVRIYLAGARVARARKPGRLLALLSVPLAAVLAWVLWTQRPQPAPEPESVFLFEELPPDPAPQARPDPSPPPPQPAPQVPVEAPPPQFGMQEDQLSEAGELSVATGNTLMTEADSVVKEPVAALPALPQMMDQPPRILKGTAPDYPGRALERQLEATVVVVISIDTLGRVTGVDVERSGGPLFDGDVVRAVKRLVFQPPVRGGQRMAARFRVPYEFKLQ